MDDQTFAMIFAGLEAAYRALPDLTWEQIAALSDEELDRQAGIELEYAQALVARNARGG